MNKQGRGGIEWCDFTCNVVVGCTMGCSYCYARKIAARGLWGCPDCKAFKPHWHLERLEQIGKRKHGARVFIDSMGDIFDAALPDHENTYRVFEFARKHPQHTFIALTKRPDLAIRFAAVPDNFWLLTSVENQRAAEIRVPSLLACGGAVKGISIEPMLRPVDLATVYGCASVPVQWVIIGAQTGGTHPVVPEKAWVRNAIDRARDSHIAVFVKSNVVKHYPEFAGIQEFPTSGMTTGTRKGR